jgi:caffeoyl-CoA O-methyltransferase
MSQRTLGLDQQLNDYLEQATLREHPAQTALRRESDRHPHAGMRSSAEQVQLLGLLIELIGARRVLEVGCFTGYGTLGMALALPPGGRVTTLDVNDGWAATGRRYWQQAGVADRIEFRSGEAHESLASLLEEKGADSFDAAYIDADKKSYDAYYEAVLKLVRPGGLIALDNVLRQGAVADPTDQAHQTVALRELNAKIRADDRVTMSLVPIGDGLMLARKR